MRIQGALSQEARIGFIGDLHGDLGALLAAARTMRARGVRVAIVTGDFGFIWPRVNYKKTLDKISRRLSALDFTLYFVDGNHEWFPELFTYPTGDDGLRRVRDNIFHIPRGYRVRLVTGRVLAALGGAHSIDRDERIPGFDWWAEESVGASDLERLGAAPADVLVGHDAPLRVPSLDWALAANELDLSEEMLAYSLAGRRLFHRGFAALQPELYVGGHYHRHVDEKVTFHNWTSRFECRVLVLDQVSRGLLCLAVIDADTLQASVFGTASGNHGPATTIGKAERCATA